MCTLSTPLPTTLPRAFSIFPCPVLSQHQLLLCASVPAEAAAVQGKGLPPSRSLPGPLGTSGGRAQTPLLRAIKGTVGCSFFFFRGEPCTFSPRRSYSGEQHVARISCGRKSVFCMGFDVPIPVMSLSLLPSPVPAWPLWCPLPAATPVM